MTKRSGTPTVSTPDSGAPAEPDGTDTIGDDGPPADAEPTGIEPTDDTDDTSTDDADTDTGAGEVPPPLAPGAGAIALLAVVWLAAMLWAAQRSISFSEAQSMAITTTAYALPGVISASLVGGAAVSLAMANLLSRRGVVRGTPRFAAAVATGLATGLLAALAVSLGYDAGSAVMLLAGTTAAAATVGGIAGGLRATPVIGALVSAALTVFAVNFGFELFRDPLLSLYGAGDTASSQLTALRRSAWTASVCNGLAAGAVAFGYLRLAARRGAARGYPGSAPRWTAYLVAGAGPGLLLLVAEVITRTAGARVLTLAGGLSEADEAAQSVLGGARVDHALLVLFLGALTAIIILGRTMGPATDRSETTPEDETTAS